MLSRWAVWIYEDNEIIGAVHLLGQIRRVHPVIIFAGQKESVHATADDLFEHVRVLAVHWVQNQHTRPRREPVPKGEENEVRRSSARQNGFGSQSARSRNRANETLAMSRRRSADEP